LISEYEIGFMKLNLTNYYFGAIVNVWLSCKVELVRSFPLILYIVTVDGGEKKYFG
jgi:hypothetical protein